MDLGNGSLLSASTLYADEVKTDYTTLNNRANFPPCKLPSNVLGYFSNYAGANGNYICNGTKGNGTALSKTYASKADNWHVLLGAWIATFSYAVALGYTDNVAVPKAEDVYFTGEQGPNSQLKWVCSNICC